MFQKNSSERFECFRRMPASQYWRFEHVAHVFNSVKQYGGSGHSLKPRIYLSNFTGSCWLAVVLDLLHREVQVL
jgi:hypothetical protein